MKIFIAGATGVLDRRMVRQFVEKNHRVVGLARDEAGKRAVESLGGEAVVCNIFDADSMAAIVEQRVIPNKRHKCLITFSVSDNVFSRLGQFNASHKIPCFVGYSLGGELHG